MKYLYTSAYTEDISFTFTHTQEDSHPKRPKAREETQHGGPPGWLEKSDPAGEICVGMDGPCRLP